MSTPALLLTPTGHLHPVEPSPLTAELFDRLQPRFAEGPGAAILQLAGRELDTVLPPELAFFRGLGTRVVGAACRQPGLETKLERLELPVDAAALAGLKEGVPPFPGGEYLSTAMLAMLWAETAAALETRLAAFPASAAECLAALHPAWHATGRVHFHLAERKNDPARPFAFLATYSTRIGESGKPKHLPLGEALRELAGKPEALARLLAPVQAAAEQSPVVRGLVERGEIFHPLGWDPATALGFLKQLPAIEAGGVVVRVPDWWRARQGARPTVRVTVGGAEPSRLGLDALLDFSLAVTLGGERLSKQEIAELLRGKDGLALLRGRWVELDRERLGQVLEHWETIEARAQGGLSLAEAMRLLSGADLDPEPDEGEAATVASWSEKVAGPWLEELLASLRKPGALDPPDPGPALKATLRPYQKIGLAWLWRLAKLGLGGCLADDMGLGKTVQVLGLLLLMKQDRPGSQTLLVLPASLIANWLAEAERFTPGLRLRVLHPSAEPTRDLLRLEGCDLAGADVLVTTYGYLHRLEVLKGRPFELVVLDEAQAIKNPGTRQVKAVKELQARVRLALTGTPIENRIGDLWSIFDFLNPGLLGSNDRFTTWNRNASKRTDGYAPLRRLLGPYVLRRLKTDKDVVPDLPDKTEMVAWCSLAKVQAALYQDSVASFEEALADLDGMARRGAVLALLMRLKQICNHPSQWLQDGRYKPEESGKLDRVRELVEEMAERQDKVLVFTQFREMCGPLDRFLAEVFGRSGLVLTGQTAVKERGRLVARFQSDDTVPYFVLSLKAGGTGLNLTAASQVIHFDRWWNPAVEDQATDRAFRIGQKKNVVVHKLVCRGTVEERIDALIRDKRKLSAEVLGSGGELSLTEMDDEALLSMVRLDLDRATADG